MSVRVDETDRKILAALQRDARSWVFEDASMEQNQEIA